MPTELKLSNSPVPPTRAVRSLWLEEALRTESGSSHPVLAGSVEADVCIVGGGYTGVWTAISLKRDDPSLDVVVLEGDLCGGGASGRNGGFVMSWWSKFTTLKKLCGVEEALRLAEASADAVAAVGQFCDEHGIDARYHHDGWVWTATSPAQVDAWRATVEAVEAAGVQAFEPLTPAEVAERTSSPMHLAGVFERSCAIVDPGRLSRGLARAAARLGVRIFEQSPVTRIVLGRRPVAHTPNGSVDAAQLVLAINAWAAQLDEYKRSLVVIASDVIATAPVPDRLSAINWTSGVAVSDSRRLVNYYRRTDEGRVVFGKGGGTLSVAGRVAAALHRASPRVQAVEGQFKRLYPMLWDVPVTESWRGPIDYSLTGLPSFVRVRGRPDVIAAAGFSGNGVGPTYVAGRILASLAQHKDDEWASTPLTSPPARRLPREPIRYLGGLTVRAGIARKEVAEDAGRRPSLLAVLVARLDPTSFVDRGGASSDGGPPAGDPR